MRTPVLFIPLLLAALMLAGCDQAEQVSQAPAAPGVTVSLPVSARIVDWDNFIGQFEAVERVELRPRVTGYLVNITFIEGDMVKAGDVLFEVDPRPFQATLDEARARLAAARARAGNARKEFERASSLVTTQAISIESRDSLESLAQAAEAEVSAAAAAVQSAELDLGYTRITSPVNGRVSYRRVDVGNAVSADDTVLTTITSVDPIHFVFQSSESAFLKYQRSKLSVGSTPVRIQLQDEITAAWSGYLDFIDSTIDPATGTIIGRALIPNPDGFLVPGMFGHMQLQAAAPYDGILLPDTAIATRGAQRIVYIVDAADKVDTRVVSLGPLYAGLRVIRSGLAADERVIINGQQRARPGMQVSASAGAIPVPELISRGLDTAIHQPRDSALQEAQASTGN